MFESAKKILRLEPRYAVERVFVRAFGTTVKCFPLIAQHIGGKGIEIGGPSNIFNKDHFLPVYPLADSLDGCNFGATTIWEGIISEGQTFRYGGRVGRQFISEAWKLDVPDDTYDFVLSCHMIEHTANPLRALKEWRRVLKANGHLLLVVPDGLRSFDRKRPVTKLSHLLDDFSRDMGEEDLTHLEESVALHEIDRTPEYQSREDFRAWLSKNVENRRMHHHVFDRKLVVDMVSTSGFKVLASETTVPWNIVVFGQKT